MNLNRMAVSFVAMSLLGLASLAGCTAKPKAEAEAPAASPGAMPSAATSPAAIPAGSAGLMAVVNNTKTAVAAGDFNQAKANFEQFETVWKPVEDGIKAKAPDAYEKIESSMDQVNGALKASDKGKGLAALQSLSDTIETVQ